MKNLCAVVALLLSGLAARGSSQTRIKIATVPDEYTPTSTLTREPVSLEDFGFEVNPETVRARVVVDYTYVDRNIYGPNDDYRGPESTIVQIPGLKYLPQAHTVVYEADGKQTVCADIQQRKGLFGVRLHIKKTGLCKVTAERTKHAEDDGWQIRRFTAIDTYFEVH